MIENNEHFQFIISATLVAIVGGIANWLMADKHSVFQFVVAIFLAGFAGFLVGELCLDAEISESISFFLCGSAGLCAELILKIARKNILKKLGALTDQNVDEEIDELDIIEKEYLKRKEEIIKKRKDQATRENNNDIL